MDRARQELKLRGTVGVRPVDPLADDLKEMVQGEHLFLIRGHLAFNAGRYHEAAEAFASAVQAKPDSARGRVNLGTSLARLGDWQGAIEQYRAALQYDPDQRVAHFNLATLALRTNNTAVAIRHFREVLRIDPKDAETHHELGQLLMRIRRPNEALVHLLRATQLRGDDEILLLDLASLLVQQGRYKEALEVLDRANKRFPARGLTASALARLLAACPDASLRDGERALNLALKVYRARSTVSHGETVAQALAELGRYDEAATWQRRLIAAAEQTGKRDLAARLRKDLVRYEAAAPRRPPP
jgi:Flp pilus assembly protein TadD